MKTTEILKNGVMATAMALPLSAAEKDLQLDFDGGKNEPTWVAENDGVMGGLSEGRPELKDGSLVFSGKLSLENNGGFSQIHTKGGGWNLEAAKGIRMRVAGDGRTYQLRLATDALHRGSSIAYAADFSTTSDGWTEVFVPFSEMEPTWRGNDLDGPPLDLTKVSEIAILLGDKNPGKFSMKIDWLKAAVK